MEKKNKLKLKKWYFKKEGVTASHEEEGEEHNQILVLIARMAHAFT